MPRVQLSDLVEIKGGGTPSRKVDEYWGGDIPWATVKDFKSTELSNPQESITELGVSKSATNVIPAGTIIVPTRMAVGKAAVAKVDMAINQDLKALFIKDKDKLDLQYFLHFLLESPRVYRRLNFLRGLAYDQTTWILPRSTGTRGSPGFDGRA